MAFASRILSKFNQLYTVQNIVPNRNVIAVRYFARRPAFRPSSRFVPRRFKDELLRNAFLDIRNKFKTAIYVRREEKLHPNGSVQQDLEKADSLSDIRPTIQTRTRSIPDVRNYLLALQDIRNKRDLPYDVGAEDMMFEALDKIEKELNKPLLRNDEQGMNRLLAEFDKINNFKKYKQNFPKSWRKDLQISLGQLEKARKEAVESMETQAKKFMMNIMVSKVAEQSK